MYLKTKRIITSSSPHVFPGDTIYGRVMVDPVQNLGDAFFCNIEKVYLCTGADGYVPKYNPTKFEFGCLADSPSLLYRFKIIVSTTHLLFSCNLSRQMLFVCSACGYAERKAATPKRLLFSLFIWLWLARLVPNRHIYKIRPKLIYTFTYVYVFWNFTRVR